MMKFRTMYSKIVRRIRWAANDAIFTAGLRRVDDLLDTPGQCILLYHGIDRAGRKDLNRRFISSAELDAQLVFFKDHAQVVSLRDFFAGRFDPSVFTLALSFDDGYRNNLEYALPLLDRYGLPATFFLTAVREAGFDYLWTDFLDLCSRLNDRPVRIESIDYHKKKKRGDYHHPDGRKLRDIARTAPWPFKQAMFKAFTANGAFREAAELRDYWEQMSQADILRLAASPLAEIGAHGYWHNNLASLPFEDACQELHNCKRFLESVSGRRVCALSYPDGSYSAQLVDYAAQLGFERQLVVNFRQPSDARDARLRARLTINPTISIENQLIAIQSGKY